MLTLTLDPEIGYLGYLKYQEPSFGNENSLGSSVKALGLKLTLLEKSTYRLSTLDLSDFSLSKISLQS